MEIMVTGKSIEITPALRSYIDSKLQRVYRIISGIMDVHVTLSVQKHLQLVDVTIKTRTSTFTSHGSTTDMYASINEGIDSLLKQARRQKRKVTSQRTRRRAEAGDIASLETPAEESGETFGGVTLIRERMPIKPMSLEEAMLQLRGGDQDFILFQNATTSDLSLLFRRKDGNLGLIETKI
jgi:putative sigma-54 modulation protein